MFEKSDKNLSHVYEHNCLEECFHQMSLRVFLHQTHRKEVSRTDKWSREFYSGCDL